MTARSKMEKVSTPPTSDGQDNITDHISPPVFEKVDLGMCKPLCPRYCNPIVKRVCGFNGTVYKIFRSDCLKTYYNECQAENGESKYYTPEHNSGSRILFILVRATRNTLNKLSILASSTNLPI
jgi:hypothetical protein